MIICGSGQRIELYKAESRGRFDFYETVISVGKTALRFYFEIKKGRETCLYNRLGVTKDIQRQQMFAITPGFHVPDWAKGALMYQIFIDRFCNGDPDNDVVVRRVYLHWLPGDEDRRTGERICQCWMWTGFTAVTCRAIMGQAGLPPGHEGGGAVSESDLRVTLQPQI